MTCQLTPNPESVTTPPLCSMHVLDKTGDFRVTWDPDRQTEVDHAAKTFTEMKAKGYLAYKVNPKGDKGEVMHSFDPRAERVILAPPLRGG